MHTVSESSGVGDLLEASSSLLFSMLVEARVHIEYAESSLTKDGGRRGRETTVTARPVLTVSLSKGRDRATLLGASVREVRGSTSAT